VTRAVRNGDVHQLFRGVFASSALELTVESRSAAVALVLPPGGAIARRTAAWLHGIDARSPGEQQVPLLLECVVPRGSEPVARAGVRCYATPLAAEDLTEIGGVPCTTPVRTCVDLLRWMPPHMGLGSADALAHRGLVTRDELLQAIGRFPGGRGVAKARRLAGFLEPLSESFGESWTRLRFIDAGFPVPTAQIPVCHDTGRLVYRLDLGWPERRVAAEYDGLEYHSSAEQRRHDDTRRQRLLTDFAWTAIPVTKGDVLGTSMRLERAFGDMLRLQPAIARRLW
jgi:hypothetical protein